MKERGGRFAVLVLLLILAAQLVLHAMLITALFFPDEAHFFAYTWLTTKGLVIYRDFFDNHPPLIEFIAAIPMKLFGATVPVVRSLSMLSQLGAAAVVFFMARKLYGDRAAVAAAMFYAGFEVMYFGFDFTIEPFLALSLPLAAFTLIVWQEKKEGRMLALAGILLGLSLLLKPQSAVFAAIAAFLAWRESGMKAAAKMVAWALLPIAVVALYFLANGALAEFLYDTVLANALGSRSATKLFLMPYEWAVLAVSMPFAAAFAALCAKRMRKAELVLLLLFGSSLLFALPRIDLFHFLPALPALSVMFAKVACEPLAGTAKKVRNVLLAVFAWVAPIMLIGLAIVFLATQNVAEEMAIGAYFSARVAGERSRITMSCQATGRNAWRVSSQTG
jgi:4-amino-4-deoxy-L-arabinose transferase-like glycosyltransferase